MDKKFDQCFEPTSDHEKAGSSHSGSNGNVPAIFLSHSGREKAFVERLYDALINANQTVFFNKHSLPKGSPFPINIEEAARGCRLGVVVLSEDFLTSKWPMRELKMLVLERGSDAKVLPVCYKLNFEDLKSPTNLSRWWSVWNEKYAEHADQHDQWKKAVQSLACFNGEVYALRTSESAYLKKVVHQICTLVPCPVPYDMSLTQGHQRLAKEVASIFERVKASHTEDSTCMVGLYGVGGSGKTTLCRTMVNCYTSQYAGRSCLIEFPSDGDKSKIVDECKIALRRLTNLSKDLVLDKVQSFEEVIPLMRDHVKRYDVFLVIDNVWDSSLEEVKRLLRMGFSSTSKILLTSRSEQILKDLLMQHTSNKYRVDPLPTPEHEEAFQIFQETFEVGNLRSLLDRNQIDRLLERCRFGGNFHPLALKALARHVKRVCSLEDLDNRKHRLSVALEEIGNADLQMVEDVIRLNYDNLHPIKRHMLLDIAVFLVPRVDVIKHSLNCDTTYTHVHQWLCFVYKELPETQVAMLIGDLASDGLIQIEAGQDGTERQIGMHDLYIDFARKEAANSSRFLILPGSTNLEKEIEWERLERVIVNEDDDTHFLEKAWNKKCEKLQLVHAIGGDHQERDSSGLYAILVFFVST